jgi:hypothetical protein
LYGLNDSNGLNVLNCATASACYATEKFDETSAVAEAIRRALFVGRRAMGFRRARYCR